MTRNELAFLIPAIIAAALIVGLGIALWRMRRPAPPALGGSGAVAPGDQRAPASEPKPLDAAEAVLGDSGFQQVGIEDLGPQSASRPPTDTPEPSRGRLARLRGRLAKSQSALGQGLLALLSKGTVTQDTWDQIEETLLVADLGAGPAGELLQRLQHEAALLGTGDPDSVKRVLRRELVALVDPSLDRSLAVDAPAGRPAVVLVVGVNGVGKTTTVGKLARVLVADGKSVVLGAADTFRAAAAQQLGTWGERVGVPVVRSEKDGGDPAAVAFDAVARGIEIGADVVLIDTAGRLQNKVGLMDELGKVKRVIEKHGPVDEVLLVLDATTGQNGLRQAEVFSQVVQVTGIVLTKLDGTAKGGIVVAVQRRLGVPVKLVGLGEGPDDLAPFDPEGFVDALLG